jgi:phenylalanyl-tRNA synthetase alpha chain
MEIDIDLSKEQELLKHLATRTDAEARRIERYLSMPDLSRTPGNPLNEIVKRVIAQPAFKGFDIIKVPEIVPTDITFDLFDFAADHPARSKSDTYYVDETNILRTHTTVMWHYYLNDPDVRRRMEAGEPVGCFCFGKVYRKDEIDRNHMNVFHQMDAWYLAPKGDANLTIEHLKEALLQFAQAVFGKDVEVRFNPDTFPYTDPSLEMEVKKGDQWLEVVGAGMVKDTVLQKLGIDSDKWHGWAFGPGLERFAMISMELPDIRLLWSDDERVKKQMQLGHKFVEVSKYPPIIRDISFIVKKDFIPNDYFDLIRDIGGDLVEEVQLLDKYENDEKFGPDRMSYTYRIFYRSPDKTLQAEEIDPLQDQVYKQTAEIYQAELR